MKFEILYSEKKELILRVFGEDEWDEIDDALTEDGIDGYSFIFGDSFVDFVFPLEFKRRDLDSFIDKRT
jgi:hypothetical protein